MLEKGTKKQWKRVRNRWGTHKHTHTERERKIVITREKERHNMIEQEREE